MQSTEAPEQITAEQRPAELERAEVQWLLTSGVLGRAVSLARVLSFICEKYFEGRGDQIKESMIAIEALGRRPDFDPQTDTIVRVTFHALRKRLQEIYQREGAGRPVRLVIPPGRYAPSFVLQQVEPANVARRIAPAPQSESSELPAAMTSPTRAIAAEVPRASSRGGRTFGIVISVLIIAAIAWVYWVARQREAKSPPSAPNVAAALPAPASVVRALMGKQGRTYVDKSGNTWTSGNYCQGGINVAAPSQRIEGTEDPALYQEGVRGIAHCVFPVTPGLHELHFYFAETSDLPAATRVATISVNAGAAVTVDVVDEAGGDGIATSTVMTGVPPENDGAIHVDFISEVSPLNSVEILPAPSAKLLPVRIVASSKPFVDSAKQVWASDRYFSGGRHGLPPPGRDREDLGIYASDRIGRFRYNIPAVPFARYRVKLYFREPWFSKESGGPGSRVFDVACNGVLLLKDFDILAEGGTEPVVKTFPDVQASATGRIELSFMPVVNYPVLDAIEVLAY